ncbi:MAG: hypothetical protein WA746_18720 [Isosphaeraceae bacterium]
MRILFLHGWTSVPGGVKPTFLKDQDHTVFNPKLPEEAVRTAQEEFDNDQPQVVVGVNGVLVPPERMGDARD